MTFSNIINAFNNSRNINYEINYLINSNIKQKNEKFIIFK